MKKLLEFVKKVQSDSRFNTFDEAALKQAVVLKILSLLDWDPFDVDEVQPEYSVEGGKIEFSLRQNNTNKVFLVMKKGSGFAKSQEELLGYAVQGNVKMAVLTNGFSWWFFLPLLQGSADEKRFLALEMNEQKGEEITQKLTEFLSKGKVISGEALKAAEDIYRTRQKAFLINESLPRAWERVMKEPEKWLIDILAEVTKELCGYKPDKEIIVEFINSRVGAKAEVSAILKPRPPLTPPKGKASVQGEDYAAKSVTAFNFKGKRHDVKSWKAMLVKICETIFPQHKDELDVLFTISGQGKEYFSRSPYEFLNCEKIPGTNIYVDVGLKAKEVVELVYRIILLFGYKEGDLTMEVK